jgi:hypothetical protein
MGDAMDGRIRPVEPTFVRPVEDNHEAHDETRRPFVVEEEEGAGPSQQDKKQKTPDDDEKAAQAHRDDVPVSPLPEGSAGSQLDLLA